MILIYPISDDMRTIGIVEAIINEIDNGLQTLLPPKPRISTRLCPSPAKDFLAVDLSSTEKQEIARLMRVNHAGEVAAQALYQGQALATKSLTIHQQMRQSALEEIDHLAWCEQRIEELDSSVSRLNIVWYVGGFFLGTVAGLMGDKWSLGFVVETEKQVAKHLHKHIEQIPIIDKKTLAILNQMQKDEQQHGVLAEALGAHPLPLAIQYLMKKASKIMTFSSYYF